MTEQWSSCLYFSLSLACTPVIKSGLIRWDSTTKSWLQMQFMTLLHCVPSKDITDTHACACLCCWSENVEAEGNVFPFFLNASRSGSVGWAELHYRSPAGPRHLL